MASLTLIVKCIAPLCTREVTSAGFSPVSVSGRKFPQSSFDHSALFCFCLSTDGNVSNVGSVSFA